MAAFTNTTMLADTTDVDAFAGKNVSTDFTETMQDLVGVYTEAYLCNLVKYDAVTNWATLNAVYKLMMSEFVARSIAVEGLKFNMADLTTRYEAQSMIVINLARMNAIEALLSKQDVQDFHGV